MNNALPRRAVLLGAVANLAACGASRRTLVAAPTVNTGAGSYPDAAIGADYRQPNAKLFYVTDRARDVGTGYGAERAQSVTYGEAVVDFGGQGTTWADVVAESNGADVKLPLRLSQFTEQGSLPATPIPFTLRNGRPVDIPAQAARYARAEQEMKAAITRQLRALGTGDVLLHVPGVDTDFANGAFSLADLWHHSGRNMMPIVYSWPSGRSGVFGYFTDRESGQFTIFHFKEFLRQLSQTPGVERIHIVAHSRGADISTTALRELIIAERAAGRNPRQTLKVENLILAAPDLSFDIVAQRIVAERLGPAFGRITAYTSDSDTALALAQRLMSGTRFGRVDPQQVPENVREVFTQVRNVNFIHVDDAGGRFGHSYFRDNPAVLSDIVILMQTCAAPGTAARPLLPLAGNFWTLPQDYLAAGHPIVGSCG